MVIKLLRRATGSWTLERKSILFFGTALLISISISFWIVHRVSKSLIMKATRQIARDYALLEIYNQHMINFDKASEQKIPLAIDGPAFNFSVRKSLYNHLIQGTLYQSRILTLDMVSQHSLLPDAGDNPVTGEERDLLLDLERDYRRLEAQQSASRLNAPETATRPAGAQPSSSPSTSSPSTSTQPASSPSSSTQSASSQSSSSQPVSSQPSAPSTASTPESAPTNSLDAIVAAKNLELGGRSTAPELFREKGPIAGHYIYYHPVRFDAICMDCHYRQGRTQPTTTSSLANEQTPFRVVRVQMPDSDVKVWSREILTVMISVAMVTLALTLLFLHLILRKLVIRPLRHLSNVSEEISRGKLNQRAEIETDDEFRELADAFNRMLRHLTHTQEQLQNVNRTLDEKVDQLAQANLHLYEANRLKSDFLANMSHELRTPLNSIIGFSDVLQDISSLTDKQKRYAANIQKSGRMLLEMINDILDLAKIEAGKLQVKPLLFDINQVLQAQCDMTRSLSEEKNIDVQLAPDNSLALVFQDAPKIQQIVNNLLSNAIKFTPEGGLVTIATGTIGTDYFHITVADTGVGIPETDFEIIFEKFRQSNSIVQGDNLTRQYSGTGLGLSIVKELCKLLGGEISLTSHVGKGSTFRVTLPRHYHNAQISEEALAVVPLASQTL